MVTTTMVIARMTELATKSATTTQPEADSSATSDDPDLHAAAHGTSARDLPEPVGVQEHDETDRVSSEHNSSVIQDGAGAHDTADDRETGADTDSDSDSDTGSDIDEAIGVGSSIEIGIEDDMQAGEWQKVQAVQAGEWQKVKAERRSQRVAGGVSKPKRFTANLLVRTQKPKGSSQPIHDEGDPDSPASLHAFHVSARAGLREYGVKAYQAIMAEFEQLYKIKGALAPVMPTDLSDAERKSLIRSSLFLNPKHDATGVFEKIKARLVANGKQQDKNLYQDRSSPTAMLESIMAVLVIAAHEQRQMAGLDIGSAFLEAGWIGEPVFMVIEKMLTTLLIHEYPELEPYRRSDGTLVVQLLKALYGTLIASKLWFDKLSGVLTRLGFVANELDTCVMNKTIKGNQLTVVIFVDDILATSKDGESLTWLIDALAKEFDHVKGGIQTDFSYLGMHVKNKTADRVVEVSMEGYEDELLKYAKVTGVRKTPATTNLFVTGTTKLLDPAALAHFHTLVAKLLYLSLRTRPMICVAVSYLTTRVTCGNEDDKRKLDRVLMYINGTKASVLTLCCTGPLRVSAHIDVAFGSHEDGKSQTGVVHKVGEATVLAKSQKQKMVSKDSTEAELVGLTDRVDGVLRLDEFMRKQGYNMDLPEIY